MKFIIVILTLLIGTFSIAQNRKGLLKKIHQFEYKAYSNTNYQTSFYDIKQGLKNYFSHLKYDSDTELDSLLIVCKIKKVTCSTFPTASATLKGSYEECVAKLYVSIQLITDSNSKILSIETYSRPVSALYGRRQLGVPHFDKLPMLKFLYQYVYHKTIPLPNELILKIEFYNAQQTKDQKKLIAGRDY